MAIRGKLAPRIVGLQLPDSPVDVRHLFGELHYHRTLSHERPRFHFLVALPVVRDLLLCAKHLFVAATRSGGRTTPTSPCPGAYANFLVSSPRGNKWT